MQEQLAEIIASGGETMVITGAGVSASSGIPTYRNAAGTWLRAAPIQHQEFLQEHSVRQRYWARSTIGWPLVGRASPGESHRSLARLEALGYLGLLVTQNVDRLHQRAGHENVVDLHGRLDRVVCLECSATVGRESLQAVLEGLNPQLVEQRGVPGPDGDADIPDTLVNGFKVPQCGECGGRLKPDVVFYGGTVSKAVVAHVEEGVRSADRILVVGSSLMVFSSFRFCRLADQLSKPVLIVNDGKTRADPIAGLKIAGDCGSVLTRLEQVLARGHAPAW